MICLAIVSTWSITSDIPQALILTGILLGSAVPINKFKNGGLALVLTPWNNIPALFSKSYPQKNAFGKLIILSSVVAISPFRAWMRLPDSGAQNVESCPVTAVIITQYLYLLTVKPYDFVIPPPWAKLCVKYWYPSLGLAASLICLFG